MPEPTHAFHRLDPPTAGPPPQLNPAGWLHDSKLQESFFQSSCWVLKVKPYLNLKSAQKQCQALAKTPTTMMHSTWSTSKPPCDAGHQLPGWLFVLFEAALLFLLQQTISNLIYNWKETESVFADHEVKTLLITTAQQNTFKWVNKPCLGHRKAALDLVWPGLFSFS